MNGIGRIPPHNHEAEQSLLGAMILSSDAITDVSDKISSSDFYLEIHKEIFEALLAMYNQSIPVDIVTLGEQLKSRGKFDLVGGSDYIAELTDMGIITSNANHYAKIIAEKSILRKLINASAEIIEKGYGIEEADSLLEIAEKSIFDISQNKVRDGLVAINEILPVTLDKIEKLSTMEGGITGLTTGFTDLDRKLAGLQKSDLVLVAARPAMGKSTFAVNICHNACIKAGASAAIFALEMPKEQLVQRILAAESQIPLGNIKNGDLSEDEWPRLIKAMGPLSKAKLYIDDSAGITVTEMRAKCRRLKMEQGLDVIMIDYLQLMSGGKAESRQQEISQISRSLKALAREMDCPVIALSQLSRAVEQRADRRPMLSDLRESGAIEQDADIVMFLYRDEYYNPDQEDNKNLAELIIAKHRNGEVGSLYLTFFGQFSLFKDCENMYINE